MKSKRLFQIFVLLTLLFSPFGNSQPVHASTASVDGLDAVTIDRNLEYWDSNYIGFVTSSIHENWWLGLSEAHNFIVTVSPITGDLIPLLILLDADGNELTRGVGTLTSTQPAGDYSIRVQPQTGAGFYFLLLRDIIQTQPITNTVLSPSSLNVGKSAVAAVSLNNVPAEGYTSAEFTCTYDSTLAEVSNITVHNRFGPDPVTAINGPHPQGNRFIVAIAGSHGDKVTTSGVVFSFDVKGLQTGHTTVDCAARVSKGDNLLVELPSIGTRLTLLDIPTVTVTPSPTPTPTIESAFCDQVQLIADVTVPDGTVFAPGATFIKTWRLKNVGSCIWTTAYRLVFFSGEQMGAPSSANFTRNVAPGQVVDISLSMTAPSAPGSYRGYWMFQNANGALFGTGAQANNPFWVDIRVSGPSATPGGPTLTPSPTATPTIKPVACDKAEFIADVNVPPGTAMSPGAAFKKTWRLKNVSTCTWTTSYRIALLSGEQMGAPSSIQLPANVPPGAMVDISLNMTAPTTAGTYRGYWIFQNDTGSPFGVGPLGNDPWFVDIAVSDSAVTPSPTSTPGGPTHSPTPSSTPGGPTSTPSPDVVYDFAVNACAATWFSGAGQLPCPGIDGDAKGFVLKVDDPQLETGAIDTRPGLLTFPQNVQNGYIQGFYPPFRVQSGDRFRSTIGCEFEATSCYAAFRIDYQIGSDPIKTFWGPFLERYDGRYYTTDISLSALAGRDVKFILTVLSAGAATGDRALWVGPIIYRPDAGPTPTLEPPTSEPPTVTPSESPTQTFTSTPSTSMYIHVASPNGGEVLNTGSTYRITWDSTPDIDKIFIGYKSCSSCLDWIAFDIPNTGYYDWNVMVGNTVNTQFRIYIIGYDTDIPGSASDESDNYITVLQPTPTSPAIVPGFLTGKVLGNKPVTVSLYDNADSLVTSVTTNTAGTFNLTAPAGTYTVIATSSGFLSARGSATISGGNTDQKITISLLAGDADNNNVIDRFDALTIGMSYNTAVPSAADFNNDGIINVLDLELLAKNYRTTGPMAWQ